MVVAVGRGCRDQCALCHRVEGVRRQRSAPLASIVVNIEAVLSCEIVVPQDFKASFNFNVVL